MTWIRNLLPNPLLILPSSNITTVQCTVQHFAPDQIAITPSSGAQNPNAKLNLNATYSGSFHLELHVGPVAQGSEFADYLVWLNYTDSSGKGFKLPDSMSSGMNFIGWDFDTASLKSIQLQPPKNHQLVFSAINLMLESEWQQYKKLVDSKHPLHGGLMPLAS